MRRVLSAFFITSALIGVTAIAFSGVVAKDDADELDEAEIGVVKIFASSYGRFNRYKGTGTGSGFVINDLGYIATNSHVISDATVFYVVADGGSVSRDVVTKQSNATVIDSDPDLDIAILRINDPSAFQPATLTSVLPAKGEPVYAVGFPGKAEEGDLTTQMLVVDATITTGVLGRNSYGPWRQNGRSLNKVQHNADVSWGNSGGPLKDECGRVIGINTRISLEAIGNSTTVVPGVNFASNISELFKMLDVHGIDFEAFDTPCISMAVRSAEDLDDIQRTLRWTLLSGAAALGAILLSGVMLLRRPRERVVQVVESYSHALRRSGQGNPPPLRQTETALPQMPGRVAAVAPSPSVRLIGRAKGGKEILIDMSVVDLRRGVVVGRSSNQPGYEIDDDSVSRKHAEFRMDEKRLHIRDLGSTNGTFLNSKRISPDRIEKLRIGDEVKLGAVALKVR